MPYSKKAIRRAPPITRDLAKLCNEAFRIARRLERIVTRIGIIEHAAHAQEAHLAKLRERQRNLTGE